MKKSAGIEKLVLKVTKVIRKTKNPQLVDDLKEGYIYFDIRFDANGKSIVIEKRVRLDKPERMLEKFVTKIVPLVEERYKEVKYFVADNPAPELTTKLTNEKELKEKMLPLFEEFSQYMKTGSMASKPTSTVEF